MRKMHTHTHTHTRALIELKVCVLNFDEGERSMYECMNDKTADKELIATIL